MLKWSCLVLYACLNLLRVGKGKKKSNAEAIFMFISVLQPGYSWTFLDAKTCSWSFMAVTDLTFSKPFTTSSWLHLHTWYLLGSCVKCSVNILVPPHFEGFGCILVSQHRARLDLTCCELTGFFKELQMGSTRCFYLAWFLLKLWGKSIMWLMVLHSVQRRLPAARGKMKGSILRFLGILKFIFS